MEFIKKDDDPRCNGIDGWLILATIEEKVVDAISNKENTITIQKSIVGNRDKKTKPLASEFIKLEDNQTLKLSEVFFCGCDSNHLSFKNGCVIPSLAKSSSICQPYDNQLTVSSSVEDYFDPKDDNEIARLGAIVAADKSCILKSKTLVGSGILFHYYNCDTDAATLAGNTMLGLTPGAWVYKQVQVPNPSYDPDWLAVDKRIFRMRESLNKDSKFNTGSRSIIERLDNEVVNIYQWNNFITKIDFSFCGDAGGEYCKYKERDYKGWLAIIEYECLAIIPPGDFTPLPKTICGKCELTSTPKAIVAPSSTPTPIPTNSGGSGSGANNNAGTTNSPGAAPNIDPGGCCIDMKILTEYFNQPRR